MCRWRNWCSCSETVRERIGVEVDVGRLELSRLSLSDMAVPPEYVAPYSQFMVIYSLVLARIAHEA